MEVTFSKGIFSRSWHNNGPARRRKTIIDSIVEKQQMTISEHLAKFKYQQTLLPTHPKDTRCIAGACGYCLSISHCRLDQDKEVLAMGIQNLFDVPTKNPDAPWFSKKFPMLSYFWKQGAVSSDKMKLVTVQDIMGDENLFYYPLNKQANCINENFQKWTKLVDLAARSITYDCLDHTYVRRSVWILRPFVRLYVAASNLMRDWVLKSLMRITGFITAKALESIFSAVCVHEGELSLLHRAHSSALPIIYVPIHKSFMDSIILRWTLIHAGLPVPFSLMSSNDSRYSSYVGGILPPDLPVNLDEYDAKMTRTATISTFVKALLKKGGSLQLLMEGNKSRTAKVSPELYGTELLKVVYDAYELRDIEDAYIVPVSVSYGILPEDSADWFSSSTRNNVHGIFSHLWEFFKLSKLEMGSCRISFGQPFGLREFFSSMNENKKFNSIMKNEDSYELYHKTFESSELNWVSPFGSTASIPSLYGEFELIDFTDNELVTVLPKINLLAFHAIYSATNATVVMGTHAVSFLLLKKFRKGTDLSNLIQEFEELVYHIGKRKRGCGFSGDLKAVVLNALQTLGPESVTLQVEDSGTTIVAPVISRDNLLRLGYYANHLLPMFGMEAIVAASVCALVGNQLNVARGFDLEIRVKDEELVDLSRIIYHAVATEMFIHSPCIVEISAIRRTIENLNDECVLQILMDEVVRSRNRRYYDSEDEEDFYLPETDPVTNKPQEDDDLPGDYFFPCYEYKIISSERNVDHLVFLKNLIAPNLEIYYFIGQELATIPKDLDGMKRIDKRIFENSVYIKLVEKYPVDSYGEFLSMDNVRASLFAFESNGLCYISSEPGCTFKYIELTNDAESQKKLEQALNNLLRLVT